MFKDDLQKYIQIKNDNEMKIDSKNEIEWERVIEMKFEKSMINFNILKTNEHENFRFINIFITKTRWNALLKEKNLKEIIKIIKLLLYNLNFYNIILYEKRYIHKTYKILNKENIIIKKLLIFARYNLNLKWYWFW